MLFAKDLKVALAALVATVGLLGFGTANASVLLKDRNEAGEQAPLYFAKEAYLNSLGASGGLAVMASSTTAHNGDVTDSNIDVLLDTAVGSYYLRYDLSGPGCNAGGSVGERAMCPVFASDYGVLPYISGTHGDSGNTTFGETLTRAGGGADESYALYRVAFDPTGTTFNHDNSDNALSSDGVLRNYIVPAGSWSAALAIRSATAIVLPRSVKTTGNVCYTITFSVWDNAGEATANGDAHVHKVSTNYACLVDTVTVAYAAATKAATATVASGFTRFMVESGVTATKATLGTATVTVRSQVMVGDSDLATTGLQPMTRQVMNPTTGGNIMATDVLGSVDFEFRSDEFTYSSPFGFGEFALGSAAGARYMGDTAQKATDLSNKTAATGRATRAATDNVRMSLSAAGSVPFSVNVGANTAANAALYEPYIGQGSYTVSWQIDRPGSQANPPAMAPPKTAGAINRDGTSVRVGYLTVATDFQNEDVNQLVEGSGTIMGSYNQRLIITNHSSRDIEWRLSSFAAETGSTVMPKEDDRWEVETSEAGTSTIIGNIGPMRQMVVKMTDLLMIDGGSRTAGVLSLSAGTGEISVVTTQVTRPEGQTDTVRHWPLQ